MNPLILETTVEDVLPAQQKLIIIDSRSHIAEALSGLVKNNIYSAPVFDSENKKLVGFLDLLDIVIYMVGVVQEDAEKPLEEIDFYELLDQSYRIREQSVTAVTDLSLRNPVTPINLKAPISEALKIFASSGTHRIPVVENPWTVVNVLTQSTVIAWLDSLIKKHQNVLGYIGNQTISELFPQHKHVITVHEDSPAIEAFQLMARHRITSVAVVDNHGALVTNLSAKDLKVFEKDAIFTKLFKTCREFVAAARSAQMNISALSFYVKPENNLTETLHKLGMLKVHRLYIIDAQHKPIGVISLGDILKVIIDSTGNK